MAIVDEDIERIRSTVSIVDIVQGYVALRKQGKNWVGLCPFHAEKSGSFNVAEQMGRYKCFGCSAGGDVFKFIQEIEHTDFVGAVELLANKAGIQLTYTSGGENKERVRRKQLVEAMDKAVEWYHARLLTSPDARPAREYLRRRGLAGDVARQFKLGWAPDDWDVMSRELGVAGDLLRDTGLAFTNKRNRLQDSFRGRVLFPIFTDSGEPVAFGGRVLPGSTDPAKYKNSPETVVYAKSRTLYGLNWAKADIVAQDQVIVCEGYTDVIGFHSAGVKRAVATCGTALTEQHVQILKRFASKVVLAFDADSAGQGAAERVYEWEEKFKVTFFVAQFPQGKDPGELSVSDPASLGKAVHDALPYLRFRLNRVMLGKPMRSPEERAKVGEQAMAVLNEHPNLMTRQLYAGEVAAHTGLPLSDLLRIAERRHRNPTVRVSQERQRGVADNAEFVALALLMQRWDDIAPWLMEELFNEELNRRAFLALAGSGGNAGAAIEAADPEAREVLERAAVTDVDADPEIEAMNLIAATVRRELGLRKRITDNSAIREDSEARVHLEQLLIPQAPQAAAEWLLGWLQRRNEERG
ncbi:MAG: dnaG [Ilumatobacteraceae bacterium]|nr:dnaG [Ilumatobacteraceae bacterium]